MLRVCLVVTILGILTAGSARAQLDSVNAPEGSLFAFVPVPPFDRDGKPVKREEPWPDGFCLFWKPGLLTRNEHIRIVAGKGWWSGVSYRVDAEAKEVTVYRVWGPDVEALPDGGWRKVSNGTNGYQGRITAPMLDRPSADWPCSARVWAGVIGSEYRIPPSNPPSSGGGGFSFPQRSIVNPCMYTNGRVVPNCHR